MVKGIPKQQLVMHEFKKMAVKVHFILKHCFPARIPPKGKSYVAVQNHHKLFDLAKCYKMNPIRGVVPGSPMLQQIEQSANVDKIDKQLKTLNSKWRNKAAKYVKEHEHITPELSFTCPGHVLDVSLDVSNVLNFSRTRVFCGHEDICQC